MTRPWLLVSGDFTPLGGMDCANHALAGHLAGVAGVRVHLVTHRAWDDLARLPAVTVHRVWRPWNRHLAGMPLLARSGRRWARRLAAEGTRTVVNGGNCRWGDVNWVHYVHAAYQPHAITQARPSHALAGTKEHGTRAIDPHQRHAGPAERQRDAARAASELQHRTAGLLRQRAPERDIAPPERPRVLPVVERRIVVPAFPTFHRHTSTIGGRRKEKGGRATRSHSIS